MTALILIMTVLLAGAIHELGHLLAARLLADKWISFHREGFRFIWYMPETATPNNQKLIGLAGFGLEIAAALATGWYLLMAVTLVHLYLYPIYAGKQSDFQWLNNT
jgi:hypothetical protein